MKDIQRFKDGVYMASCPQMRLLVSYYQGFYKGFYFVCKMLSWFLLPIESLVGLDQIS